MRRGGDLKPHRRWRGLAGKQHAAVAEIALLDASGKTLDQSAWKIAFVDSEEMAKENGAAVNAINGRSADYWHTAYSAAIVPAHPHQLVIDLGASTTVARVRYTPRQGNEKTGGRIKGYRMFVGDGLTGK